MQKPPAAAIAERLEGLTVLDAPGEAIGKTIRNVIPDGAIKDGLSGTQLGHALHPLLTDLPIGTFTSAFLLDIFGGKQSEQAADRLIAIGLASAPPTFASGWNDWADTEPADDAVRRVGLLHAASNGGAVALMAASLVARKKGKRGKGKLLGLASLTLMSAGGWLGGHLSYAQGVGVNMTAHEDLPDDWTATDVKPGDLEEGKPACASVDGTPVLLVKSNGTIHALADTCTHRGGALHEGDVEGDTIVCPLHASKFDLTDGSVLEGPAAHPQPVLEARAQNGAVEVRAKH